MTQYVSCGTLNRTHCYFAMHLLIKSNRVEIHLQREDEAGAGKDTEGGGHQNQERRSADVAERARCGQQHRQTVGDAEGRGSETAG